MKKKLSILIVFMVSLFAFTSGVAASFCPGDNYTFTLQGKGILLSTSSNSNIKCKNKIQSGTIAKAILDKVKSFDPTILSGVIDDIVDFDSAEVSCHIGDVEYGKTYYVYYLTYNTDGALDTVVNSIIDVAKAIKNGEKPSIPKKEISINSEKKCSKEGKDNSSKNNEEAVEELQEAVDFCNPDSNPQVLAAFRLIGYVIVVVKILVPLVLIVMGMIDMSKAVVDGKEGELQKHVITFGKRAAIGALVFFTPTIILGLFEGVSSIRSSWHNVKSRYDNCLNCLLKPGDCPDVKIINDK